MKSPVVKRSIVIARHKTSVSLEDAFWKGLKDIADDRNLTLSDLVATIDTDRRHGNLSSAIRLFVLDHYRNKTARGEPASRDLIGIRVARRQRCAPSRSSGGLTAAAPVRRRRASRRRRRNVSARGTARGFGRRQHVDRRAAAAALDCHRRGCRHRRRHRRGDRRRLAPLDGAAGSRGAARRSLLALARSRSIVSICLDCCSTARNASQLASALASTVRGGAAAGPSTRSRRWAARRRRSVVAPDSVSTRIERRVGKIDVRADREIGAAGAGDRRCSAAPGQPRW